MSAIGTTTDHADAIAVLTSLLADVTAIRAAVLGITAQLDADAGITDTDYAAENNPAALTTTA